MYFRECLVENVGPIKLLDFTLALSDNGTPQPVILVGGKGSGKSILLSYIFDVLIEFAMIAIYDVFLGHGGVTTPYFRWIFTTNQRSDTLYGIALLEFSEDGNRSSYVEKTGTLDATTYTEKLGERFQEVKSWLSDGNFKNVEPKNKAR